MLVNFSRTVILYLLLIVAMRVMGKKQVGDLDPIEFVVILLLSELASIPMQDMDLPLINSVVSILTLIALEFILSSLTLKSHTLRKLLDGSPAIVVRGGKMDVNVMRNCRYTVEEVMELLRQEGYPDIRDVEFAILENSGKISIIPTPSGKPATAKDLNLNVQTGAMPYPVIIDGKVSAENLDLAGISESDLNSMLLDAGISSPAEIFFAVFDSNGEFYFQKKGDLTGI